MLSFNEINQLIKTIGDSNVEELELESDGLRLVISKRIDAGFASAANADNRPVALEIPQVQSMQPVPADTGIGQSSARLMSVETTEAQPAEDASNYHRIISPMVGTFYRASSPDKPPFVNAGDQVSERTVVCILEAMKLMNELEAECSGEIVQILAENGQLVEYGQPLFLVKKQ